MRTLLLSCVLLCILAFTASSTTSPMSSYTPFWTYDVLKSPQDVVVELAQQYGVPIDFVMVIWDKECSLQPICVESHAGARGPFQVLERTAVDHLGSPSGWDKSFYLNAAAGIKFLAESLKECVLLRSAAHRYYTGSCSQKGWGYGNPSGAQYISDVMDRLMKRQME